MEIELKFIVSPKDMRRLPRLGLIDTRMRGRARSAELRSIYFDTPDLALRDHDVALRLRHDAKGWVQTVKGRGEAIGGLHLRPEYEWRMPRKALDLSRIEATPFAPLFSRKRVRKRLAPAFSTRFRRTVVPLDLGEGCTAELCLDVGEIAAGSRRQPIGEVEIELTGGDPARLVDFALELTRALPLRLAQRSKADSGYALLRGRPRSPCRAARPGLAAEMTPVHVMRLLAAACIEQVQANADGFLAGREREYLHQLRVGWRRLRSALPMPPDASWKAALASLRPELRWLSHALGAARNWDVFATEILPPIDRHLSQSPDLAREIAVFRRRCARLRRHHGEAAREAIRSARYQRLLLRLARLLSAPPPAAPRRAGGGLAGSVVEFAASVLSRRHRKLLRAGEGLATASAAERHRARIAAKKLRYACDFFGSLFPGKKVKRYVATLANLQDVLGILNDMANGLRMIEEAEGSGRKPTGIAGPIIGWLSADEQRKLPDLASAWRRFESMKPFWPGVRLEDRAA